MPSIIMPPVHKLEEYISRIKAIYTEKIQDLNKDTVVAELKRNIPELSNVDKFKESPSLTTYVNYKTNKFAESCFSRKNSD